MLGKNIKKFMDLKGWKQSDLAKNAGIDQGRLSQILSGVNKNPTIGTLRKMANALNVSVDELIGAKPHDRILPIPIIGKAIASPEGAYYTDQDFPPGAANEYWEVKDENAFALEVESDSMAPRIKAGDMIIITPNKVCKPNGLCVVKLKNGKVFLKRVEHHADIVLLKSDNLDYPTLAIRPEEIEWSYRVEAIIPG